MTQPKVLVLRAAGINCDMETAHAFELAGAVAKCIHVNRIIENPDMLSEYQIMVFPGGFSYGDDVAAGRILANQFMHHLSERVKTFINNGKLVLGICNGFQVLVKSGILGTVASQNDTQAITITHNDSGKFEDRWCHLEPISSKCVFIQQGQRIYLPIAHGEGKVVFNNPEVLDELKSDDRIVFKYVDANGNFGDFPVNPNGSTDSIAGICDSTGRVLGLMPHPERYVRHTQHPHWSRIKGKDGSCADGRTIFENAVRYVKQNLLN